MTCGSKPKRLRLVYIGLFATVPVMFAAFLLTAQFSGTPIAIATSPEPPAYIADIFGGNTVGQSFHASHDGLCRIDLRLRPVKGECRVAFRLWQEGLEEKAIGNSFPCPQDESAWYTVRFPRIASSKDTPFRWEVSLAELTSDAYVSLEATAADTIPDGTLYVNDQVTGSDAVFVPYYCTAQAGASLLADWLKREHDPISTNHLLVLVVLMAATFVALLILPSRDRLTRVRAMAKLPPSQKIRKIASQIAALLVIVCIVGLAVMLAARVRLWAWPSAHLRAIEAEPSQQVEGPWVAYDFIANMAAEETKIDSPESEYVKPGWVALREDRRPVLRMHTPSAVYYTVDVPPGAWLHAAATLDPAVWSPDRGDGVLFIVRTIVDGAEETVYYQEIDPKNRTEDRRWYDFDVDLNPYAGQTITLLFITYPMETNDWDWGVWGMPLVLTSKEITQ
ncbi:MAG: hypothetical protein AB8I69_15680 [Anaerolineae bacterium]